MHANPTLQLIRLAGHPTLTLISENTWFPEIDLLMIEMINLPLFIFHFWLMMKSCLKSVMNVVFYSQKTGLSLVLISHRWILYLLLK